MFASCLYLRNIDIYFLELGENKYSCDVSCVELTRYAGVHCRFTALYITFNRKTTKSSLSSMISERFNWYRCDSGPSLFNRTVLLKSKTNWDTHEYYLIKKIEILCSMWKNGIQNLVFFKSWNQMGLYRDYVWHKENIHVWTPPPSRNGYLRNKELITCNTSC